MPDENVPDPARPERSPHSFEADESLPDTSSPVTVYWRPGCLMSDGLMRGLERWGLPFERIDIWQDPDAAAFVRSVADGSETVPTVVVRGLALVNPDTRAVLRVVAERAPEALPAAAKQDLARPPSRIGQVLGRVLGDDR